MHGIASREHWTWKDWVAVLTLILISGLLLFGSRPARRGDAHSSENNRMLKAICAKLDTCREEK